MSGVNNTLDPNRPDAVRLGIGEARALGEAALLRIGFADDDARTASIPSNSTEELSRWLCRRARSPMSSGSR